MTAYYIVKCSSTFKGLADYRYMAIFVLMAQTNSDFQDPGQFVQALLDERGCVSPFGFVKIKMTHYPISYPERCGLANQKHALNT